jgi:signal transduction histidine kinase
MTDLRADDRGTDGVVGPARGRVFPGRARRWVVDGALAAAAAYAAVVLTVEISAGLPASTRWFALVLAAAHGAALVLRNVSLRAVLAVQAGTAIAYVALGLPVFMLGPAILVTLYTVGSRLPRRPAVIMLGAVQALLVILLWPSHRGFAPWVQYAVILAVAWFLGDVTRRWRDAATAHARRAAELTQARDELARLAVIAERVRIARELHDVVAHSMSVIAMHAGSGRLAADRNPAAARRALEVVERSSRETLAEMRRIVAVLRDAENPGAGLAPAPRIQDVHRLVAEVAEAGVTVEVHTAGDLTRVPDGVSLTAYRIVQEALTNVVRHASPASARLSITVEDQEIVFDIVNEGVRSSGSRTATRASEGHGTIGMRERAALYGGRLAAGPRPEGGWRVFARLPYDAVNR